MVRSSNVSCAMDVFYYRMGSIGHADCSAASCIIITTYTSLYHMVHTWLGTTLRSMLLQVAKYKKGVPWGISNRVCVCVCDAQSFQQTPQRSLTYSTSLQHCLHCSNVCVCVRELCELFEIMPWPTSPLGTLDHPNQATALPGVPHMKFICTKGLVESVQGTQCANDGAVHDTTYVADHPCAKAPVCVQ